MSTVSDTKSLGRQLLIICGIRLCSVLNSKFTSLDEISFLAPNVLFWIKSLVSHFVCVSFFINFFLFFLFQIFKIIDRNCFTDVPKSSTILLLEKISNFLYDADDDLGNYRICEELLSAFKRFV